MQKFLDYLERYVEWVALGLGALFFLWMIWGYVVNTPAKTKVGSTELSASEVDQYVQNNSAKKLDEEIRRKHNVPMTVEPMSKEVLAKLDLVGAPNPVLAFLPWDDSGAPSLLPATGPQQQKVLVQNLPTVPPAQPIDVEFIRALVPADSLNPPPAAGQPPVAPVAGAPKVDKDVVTTFWKIPTAQLAKAFNDSFGAAKIPSLLITEFLDVTLIREEKLPSGQWGNSVEVPRLSNQAFPAEPKAGDRMADAEFIKWAGGNQAAILTPPMYAGSDPTWLVLDQIEQGLKPGLPAAAQPVNQTQPPPPAAPVPAYVRPGPPRRPPASPQYQQQYYTPAPPAGSGSIYYAPQDPGRPGNNGRVLLAAGGGSSGHMEGDTTPGPSGPGRGYAPPRYIPPPPPAPRYTPPPPPQYVPPANPDETDNTDQGTPGLPPVVGAGMTGLIVPAGPFDPNKLVSTTPPTPPAPASQPSLMDIGLYVHDDTVKPGHSYRYKIHYKLRNPVWDIATICAKPDMAKEIGLLSADSPWSKQVDVDPKTMFYCDKGRPLNDQLVNFVVFTWNQGQWQYKRFTIQPGDEVGSPQKDLPDFSTGWTLANVHDDPISTHRLVILLPDDGGAPQERDASKEGDSRELRDKLQTAIEAKPAIASAAASAG